MYKGSQGQDTEEVQLRWISGSAPAENERTAEQVSEQATETDCGAGFWDHQGTNGWQEIPVARIRERARRMVFVVHSLQLAEDIQSLAGTGGGPMPKSGPKQRLEDG